MLEAPGVSRTLLLGSKEFPSLAAPINHYRLLPLRENDAMLANPGNAQAFLKASCDHVPLLNSAYDLSRVIVCPSEEPYGRFPFTAIVVLPEDVR